MALITIGFFLIILIVIALGRRSQGLAAKRRWLVLVAVLGLVMACITVLVATDFFSIDACLDKGGRWDAEIKACQYEETLRPS